MKMAFCTPFQHSWGEEVQRQAGRVYNPPDQYSGHGYSHLFLNLESPRLGRMRSRLQQVPGVWQSFCGPKEQQRIMMEIPYSGWKLLHGKGCNTLSGQEGLGTWPNQPCLCSATQPRQGTQRSISLAENNPANP